jgi:uncharacterized membrane protein YGL010W
MGQRQAACPKPRMLTRLHRGSQPGARASFSVQPVYHRIAMLGGHTNEQWIAQYSGSHQHPVNRVCHTLGIPLILVSLALLLASIFVHRLWLYALGLFVVGWTLQFIGHAFERKEPEFFHDWRFLFVGVRWWWAKIHGKA